MQHPTRLLFALALAALPLASAAQHDHHGQGAAMAGQAASAMSEGEIRKIDKATGKLTIKHGPLARLDMPPMTMAFRVSEPGMLDQVKPGDKVRFEADKRNGQLVVVKMEPAK